MFDGHYQPRLPADLGFYDLRVPEVRAAQAELAADHGIEGFCYWHYWFHGMRLLDRPFDGGSRRRRAGLPLLPIMGERDLVPALARVRCSSKVLQEQTYSEADDIAHVRWLLTAFADPRYIRVNDRPVFLVYRPFDLPDAERTTTRSGRSACGNGLPEPYLIGINAHHPDRDTRPLGFDTNAELRAAALGGAGPDRPRSEDLRLHDRDAEHARQVRDYPCHPCVMVSWDNTPRRGDDGIVFINSTPESFEQHLREAAESIPSRPG